MNARYTPDQAMEGGSFFPYFFSWLRRANATLDRVNAAKIAGSAGRETVPLFSAVQPITPAWADKNVGTDKYVMAARKAGWQYDGMWFDPGQALTVKDSILIGASTYANALDLCMDQGIIA